ncbi:hypothetical protein BDW59DRAFT_173997 [Aspergillus cavernicola]|uniref:Transcription factor domain-containing protein n=1 Tax=Aspergillus cavernicola TaxID=176166 RepID=A0ABR4I374_9EURO
MPTQAHCGTSLDRVNLNLVGSPTHKYGMLELQVYEDPLCAMEEMSPCSFPVWPQKTRHLWSNIFKICYNQDPILDDGGYESILENCLALVELGEEMQASDIISQSVSITLLGFDQQLYHLISQDPVSWVKLAVCIRSAPIFQESMIHLVGKWGLLEGKDHDTLAKNIRDLCQVKLQSLESIKKAVELQIVDHVRRPRSDVARPPETNSLFAWMALTFYQQWLCQSFVESHNYRAPDGGAAFYRAIAAGGDAYLNKLDQEIAHFPFAESGTENQTENTSNLKELENDLNELKKGIIGFVSDLLVNQAKYDPAILGELPYLTCCKVREDEMPPKTEPSAISYDITQGTGDITAIDLQESFLPSEPIMNNGIQLPADMLGFNHTSTTDFLMSPEMQTLSGFDAFNTFTHQSALSWDDPIHFPRITPVSRMPSLSGIANGMYQMTHFDQDSNNLVGTMDMFGVVPIEDADDYVQNDGSMAFI